MRLVPIAALVLSAFASAQDLREDVPVPPFRKGLPIPKLNLTWNVSYCEEERGRFRTQAYPEGSGRGLQLQWKWFPDKSSARGMRYDSSRVEFEGIVTALAVLDQGVLVVAVEGRGEGDGRMRLERVDLSPPEFDTPSRTIRAGRELARRRLWESDQPGRNVIGPLKRWPGPGPARLVAVMWDTPEIRVFDVESSTWSRLAAVRSFGEPGVFDVPELVRTHHGLSIKNHRRHGYVLVLDPAYG